MNGQEKSHSAIVAGKPTNGAGQPAEEPVEPRAGAKGKANQQSTSRTLCRLDASQALERIRQAATPALPSSPEAGAGCLNWARPDLCGGRPEMDVPNAIVSRFSAVFVKIHGEKALDSRSLRGNSLCSRAGNFFDAEQGTRREFPRALQAWPR